MTADRWWVRLAARWLARIDGVSAHLRLAMLALTGVSTMSVALNSYGLGHFAAPVTAVLAAGMLVYAYLYTEGGVWNQVGRDKKDMSANFSGPTMRMDDELIGLAVFAAVNGREPTPDERRVISDAVDAGWQDYRDGLPAEALAADDGNGRRANA